MDNETKNILTSKTFWGVVVMAISAILHAFHKDLDAQMQTDIVNQLAALGDLIGGVLAIYGRMKADKGLTILPQKKDTPPNPPTS